MTLLKKTNKDLASTLLNNMKNGDPSLSLLLDFFLGMLKNDEKLQIEKEHQRNLEFTKKVEDFGTMQSKHQNWNQIDNHGCLIDPHAKFEKVEGGSENSGADQYVKVHTCVQTNDNLESARLESEKIFQEFEERKSTIQAETEDLARKISQRKQAMAMMRGLIGVIQDEKSKVNDAVKNMHQDFSQIKDVNSSDRGFMAR